jgi:hypothetical protein
MSFSPYTLAGHQFLGGGVELNPGDKFTFSAMGGRLQKSVRPDSLNLAIPAYHRVGGGFKPNITLGSKHCSHLFTPVTMKTHCAFRPTVLPNCLWKFDSRLKRQFFVKKHLTDYSSVPTENTLAPLVSDGRGIIPGFNYRESTRRFNAFKTAINHNSALPVGFGLERVDPDIKHWALITATTIL